MKKKEDQERKRERNQNRGGRDDAAMPIEPTISKARPENHWRAFHTFKLFSLFFLFLLDGNGVGASSDRTSDPRIAYYTACVTPYTRRRHKCGGQHDSTGTITTQRGPRTERQRVRDFIYFLSFL